MRKNTTKMWDWKEQELANAALSSIEKGDKKNLVKVALLMCLMVVGLYFVFNLPILIYNDHIRRSLSATEIEK